MVSALSSVVSGIGSFVPSLFSAIGNNRDRGSWVENHPLESAIFQGYFNNQLQKSLMKEQFNYNKYFTEHGHQAEVQDLRNAGLNPILSANNGAYSQVGLGSSSSPDILQGASALSNAKTNRQMQKMSALDIMSQLDVRNSTSALQKAQADVEHARTHNINMDTELKSTQIILNNVNKQIADIDKKIRDKDFNSYDIRLKNDLEKTRASIISASASVINAKANKVSAESNAAYNQRRSGGFSSSWNIGGKLFGISHSSTGNKPGSNIRYQTETLPNGKKIKVKVYE